MKTKKTTVNSGIIPVQPITKLLSEPFKNISPLMQRVFDRYSPNTKRAYFKAWMDFATFRELPSQEEALKDLLQRIKGEANAICLDYQTDMEGRKLKPKTVSLRLTAIRAIVKDFFTMGVGQWVLDFPMPKRVRAYKDMRGPGYQAVEAVLEELGRQHDPMSARDLAIIWLLWSNALRREEVASLDVEHVDWQESKISVLRKGEVQRYWLTIPSEVLEALRKWMQIRGHQAGSLFKNFDRAKKGDRLTGQSIYRLTKKYRLMRPHAIRHSSGTRVAQLTKDPYAVKEHMGQKSLDMALQYLDHLKDMAGQTANMLAKKKRTEEGDK